MSCDGYGCTAAARGGRDFGGGRVVLEYLQAESSRPIGDNAQRCIARQVHGTAMHGTAVHGKCTAVHYHAVHWGTLASGGDGRCGQVTFHQSASAAETLGLFQPWVLVHEEASLALHVVISSCPLTRPLYRAWSMGEFGSALRKTARARFGRNLPTSKHSSQTTRLSYQEGGGSLGAGVRQREEDRREGTSTAPGRRLGCPSSRLASLPCTY